LASDQGARREGISRPHGGLFFLLQDITACCSSEWSE